MPLLFVYGLAGDRERVGIAHVERGEDGEAGHDGRANESRAIAQDGGRDRSQDERDPSHEDEWIEALDRESVVADVELHSQRRRPEHDDNERHEWQCQRGA